MVLDSQADVLYVSETISIYLGLSQVEMTGNSITEYIHPEDWQQFYTVFCSSCEWSQMCSVRVKSSLTKRANKKDSLRASPGFKVLRMDMTFCNGCRLVVCSSLPSPILSSISVRASSIVITTAVDLSIIHVDSSAAEMLCEPDYCSSLDLKGMSFYSIVHVDEVEIIRKMHLEEHVVIDNIDEKYDRLIHHYLHISVTKAKSSKLAKRRLSPETFEMIRKTGIAQGKRQFTPELAKLCRQVIKEDLKERRATVMVELAQAGRSIRKANRSFASYKTKITVFPAPDGTLTASKRQWRK
uniref:PAS domain-containing protein n=1 Tax=Angiostrongylus cantonensis TaxID=6313 RepID=A0A158P736_ANGCA